MSAQLLHGGSDSGSPSRAQTGSRAASAPPTFSRQRSSEPAYRSSLTSTCRRRPRIAREPARLPRCPRVRGRRASRVTCQPLTDAHRARALTAPRAGLARLCSRLLEQPGDAQRACLVVGTSVSSRPSSRAPTLPWNLAISVRDEADELVAAERTISLRADRLDRASIQGMCWANLVRPIVRGCRAGRSLTTFVRRGLLSAIPASSSRRSQDLARRLRRTAARSRLPPSRRAPRPRSLSLRWPSHTPGSAFLRLLSHMSTPLGTGPRDPRRSRSRIACRIGGGHDASLAEQLGTRCGDTPLSPPIHTCRVPPSAPRTRSRRRRRASRMARFVTLRPAAYPERTSIRRSRGSRRSSAVYVPRAPFACCRSSGPLACVRSADRRPPPLARSLSVASVSRARWSCDLTYSAGSLASLRRSAAPPPHRGVRYPSVRRRRARGGGCGRAAVSAPRSACARLRS